MMFNYMYSFNEGANILRGVTSMRPPELGHIVKSSLKPKGILISNEYKHLKLDLFIIIAWVLNERACMHALSG